jgi:hypothetical protein
MLASKLMQAADGVYAMLTEDQREKLAQAVSALGDVIIELLGEDVEDAAA